VDVGGGTTDLSLIAVLEREGNLELRSIAVGEHILLGGDNMDLAWPMAWRASWRRGQAARCLANPRAGPWLPRCQGAVAGRCLQAVPVVVPSRGSKLIGGSIRTEVTRTKCWPCWSRAFPKVAVSDKPKTRARGARSWACPMRRMRPSRAIWRPF
jgi:hypothetical protein